MKRTIWTLSLLTLFGTGSASAVAYKGDVNKDGKLDMADMVLLAKAIKGGSTDSKYDLNASGKADDADLTILANYIIGKILKEDTGVNIGIGGWDDDGEDWGGTVGMPARHAIARSLDETRFSISDVKYDLDLKKQYVDWSISSDGEVCGMLIEMKLGCAHNPNAADMIKMSPDGITSDHKLYGTPTGTRPEYSDGCYIRYILFSPSLTPLKGNEGVLARMYADQLFDWADFIDCQVVGPDSSVAEIIPFHTAHFNGHEFVMTENMTIDASEMPQEILVGDSFYLRVIFMPEEASDKSFTWSSSNPAVATVDKWGRVEIHAEGTATIRAADNYGHSASVEIKAKKELSTIDEIATDSRGDSGVSVRKIVRDGTILIIRDGAVYSTLGTKL